MELGTGVFLSSIIVCIVLLYGFTKDRWPWRFIISRTLMGIAILVTMSGAFIVGAHYWNQLVPIQIARQTEYGGLRLGISEDEVIYIKGIPTSVITQDLSEGPWQSFGVLKSSELPKGKTLKDYLLWSYDVFEHSLVVAFDNRKKVRSIACFSKDKIYRCPEIGGVQDGTSEAEMIRKFGPPTRSEIKGVTKSAEYDAIGVEFKLEKETIYRLQVGEMPLH